MAIAAVGVLGVSTSASAQTSLPAPGTSGVSVHISIGGGNPGDYWMIGNAPAPAPDKCPACGRRPGRCNHKPPMPPKADRPGAPAPGFDPGMSPADNPAAMHNSNPGGKNNPGGMSNKPGGMSNDKPGKGNNKGGSHRK